MHITWHLAAVAALAAAGPLAAQDTTAARHDSAMVLDHTFTTPVGEPVRVFLAKDMPYRVVIEGTNIRLKLRPLSGAVAPPLIEPFLSGVSAAHETMWTVTPRADAVYEFTTSGGALGTAITLRVYAANPPHTH